MSQISMPSKILSPGKLEEGDMTYSREEGLSRVAGRLADPAPLAMGGFATSLITVCFAMMNLRDVSIQTVNIGNLCFVASIGLLISAQWEMVRGNTFSYTVLSAYGLFYGGYGFLLLPTLNITQSYGGPLTPEYNNAFGFYILMWGVFNTFFLITSTAYNCVYVLIFVCLECCLLIDGSSYFILANGDQTSFLRMQQVSGAFGLVAGLAGYYTCAHYMCEEALPFRLPMGQLKKRGKARDD
ncbi:hypothetical protein BU24DRAFT_415788 [Aaosphaeria arxii CBS 175.79]|uniref:Uncharacterized protein n=1 Tax=Aaosphaeria arxii CBS 175.79 TaxID=1450172 RepID=A0A6A5X6F5_9PLEO|nr:uncharacterized protein BU24DRAFT_415788 [Aaosphaeria arxii CBS 175.79]KAF2008427.1 hypothetical protein BU24DRAFT_415788 [Aaosphaeria arxii CBS 175.79]